MLSAAMELEDLNEYILKFRENKFIKKLVLAACRSNINFCDIFREVLRRNGVMWCGKRKHLLGKIRPVSFPMGPSKSVTLFVLYLRYSVKLSMHV